MARYVDQNQVQYSYAELLRIAQYYSFVIGVIISKTGPMEISTEDATLFQISGLAAVLDTSEDRDGLMIRLLGDDEWPEGGNAVKTM